MGWYYISLATAYSWNVDVAVILEDKLFNIERISHCEWDQLQSVKSSTFREMYAIWFGLCQFHALLFNQVLDWFTDSANTVSIVKRGSMIPELHNLALKIFTICSQSNIKLRVIWLPREKISRADFFSRIIDSDDWEVDPFWFKYNFGYAVNRSFHGCL